MRQEVGQVDFVLNTGDSIYAADYGDISRERMLLQWDLWDSIVMKELGDFDLLSCLGNHDSWWAAPTEDDPMRGKSFAVERLGILGRYYAVDRGPWKILALDSNNQGFLDTEQRQWLDAQFADMPAEQPVMIMSHQPVVTHRALWEGMAPWQKEILDPLHETSRRVTFISGHTHELDSAAFHNLSFYCNGAFSGHWWEPGPENDGSRNGTPIGFAVLELYPDGRVTSKYHGYTRDELLTGSRPEPLKPT
jgi:Icc protein